MKFFLVLILLYPVSSEAADKKSLANIISYITVSVQIGGNSIHSYRSVDRKREFKQQILKTGIAIGLSELTKLIVHEDRPDHSDNKSFWSEHSAIAAANQDWDYKFGLPLTATTAGGRVVAKKHFIWDVATGIGVGTLVERMVN